MEDDERDGDIPERSFAKMAIQTEEYQALRLEIYRLRGQLREVLEEKEEMVDNFRVTTSVLLERIKELEAERAGTLERPQTAAIMGRIESKNRPPPRQDLPPRPVSRSRSVEGMSPRFEDASPTTSRRRLITASPPPQDEESKVSICGNCQQKIASHLVASHTVTCYRTTFRCNACGELLPLKQKDEHQDSWTNSTRFFNAVRSGDLVTLQIISEHGVDVNQTERNTLETCIHIAARSGNLDLLTFAISRGAELDVCNKNGETPLHLAVDNGHERFAVHLVELGASMDVQTKNGGMTPLHLAAKNGSTAIASFFVAQGANMNVLNALGDSATDIAQRKGNLDTVMVFAARGASLRPGSRGSSR
eukprot:GILJ01005283.1.p1 GENE.GILJ01005283.1~~GILJ01005283.1.p1  ORF type:complete len:363 (-),score=31.17 GILJ01005283.1:111-1199(-)